MRFLLLQDGWTTRPVSGGCEIQKSMDFLVKTFPQPACCLFRLNFSH